MDVVIEENKHVQKFFKLHAMFAETVRQEIYQNAEKMIHEKAYKIKTVKGVKYKEKTVIEYKIVVNAASPIS